jgi:DNA-directed RNA polymerase subunit beta'
LLGKRVDYSGRSVIVVGPDLKLHQCGLPKLMALELFKPFIYNKLEEKGYVTTVKSAKKMVEQEKPEVWDVLEEVIREHPVMLNRAPTLHRLGIQAFEPVLIEGKAIQLHPLVCTAFNADFDGDQMAVHVPLSVEAQIEARVLMMSTNNILSPANGRPIILPTQDIVLGLYFLTRERPKAKGEGRRFSDPNEVRMALDAGEVDVHAKVKCRFRGNTEETTIGRIIFSEILPEELPFSLINRTMDKKALADVVDKCYRLAGNKQTVLLADKLMTLGFTWSSKAGISICIDDMTIPEKKTQLLDEASAEVHKIQEQYREGLITDGERYNKIIDIWAQVGEKISAEMMKGLATELIQDEKGNMVSTPSFNPIFIMADSGARGSVAQLRQLAGMRGLMAKPSGEIIETPITSNFKEGLSVLQYFVSTHGARKGLADTALKTANSGYLTRRLVDVAQDCIISTIDCGTMDGIEITPLVEGGEVIESLGERLLGRVTLEAIRDPYTDAVIVPEKTEINEDLVKAIEAAGIEKVKIRSVLTCQKDYGICALCYGRDLSRGHMVNIGETVGIIAAQSIGEPGTQLTMRTFHIGGAATRRVEQSHIETRFGGTLKLINVNVMKNREGTQTVMNRNGEFTVMDEGGRERERYPLTYGAKLLVAEGTKLKPGQMISEWDPYTIPIMTNLGGVVHFADIVEGSTMQEQLDAVTGLSRKVIMESKDVARRPRVTVLPEGQAPTGTEPSFLLPVGANITVSEGELVTPGDAIAKIPRETTKTKDITGGLPRVAELFEARKPKEVAIISEIDGVVSFGKDLKGKRRVVVTPENGTACEYLIPKGKHVSVLEGDHVRAGEALMDGSANPHDILAVLGEKALAKYLVDEVQEVYKLQGVSINDKHIETIVRQMLRKVKVKDPGDTTFLVGEQVEKLEYKEVNAKIIADGGKPATAEAQLLGITKASLSTESFISAASFQETTKVFTEAAINGKIDYLRGLKENVIMGRLIPAGTGMPNYQSLMIEVAGETLPLTDEDEEQDLAINTGSAVRKEMEAGSSVKQ